MEEFVQQPDNTRVVMPQERVPILPYDQIQAVLSKVKPTPEFKADNRTETQRKQDRQISDYLIYQEEKRQNLQEASKAVDAMFTMISPSTYVGAATRNNGLSYWENVASGEGFDNPVSNAAFDALLGGVTGLAAIKGATKGVSKQMTKQITKEVRASKEAISPSNNVVYTFRPIEEVNEPIKLVDSNGNIEEWVVTPESFKKAKEVMGDNALYIDAQDRELSGLAAPSQLSDDAKKYGDIVLQKFKDFKINIPRNLDFNKEIYDFYPFQYMNKSTGEKYPRNASGFYDPDTDQAFILKQGSVDEMTEPIYNSIQIHEGISHRTDKLIPRKIRAKYKDLARSEFNNDWREVRATSNEMDYYMRQKYGDNYFDLIDPESLFRDSEVYMDFLSKLSEINGYGRRFVKNPQRIKYMDKFIKTLPLPSATLLFLSNQQQTQ